MKNISYPMIVLGMVVTTSQAAMAATPSTPSVSSIETGAAFMTKAEFQKQIEIMKRDLLPGTFQIARPVLKAEGSAAALEYWLRPRPPAVHSAEAEYVIILEGSGTLRSGGSLTNAHETRPGLLEGDDIAGGTLRQLKAGDTLLIPAGMPHWFGIDTAGLTMLGIKMSKPATGK